VNDTPAYVMYLMTLLWHSCSRARWIAPRPRDCIDYIAAVCGRCGLLPTSRAAGCSHVADNPL